MKNKIIRSFKEQIANIMKWFVVKLFKNGELVGIDKTDTSVYSPALEFQAKGFDINSCEKQNTFGISAEEADNKIKKLLSEYFEQKGIYPKYNQDEFEEEFQRVFTPYRKGWHQIITINEDTINATIKEGHKNGNYIYGHYENGEFKQDYVGRCTDQELRERIKHRLNPRDNNYAQFNERGTSHVTFRYAQNDDEAINIECLLYHYYGGKAKLINNDHPSLENGRKCPVTNCDKS